MKASTLRGSTSLITVLLVGYGCSSDSGDGSTSIDIGSDSGGPVAGDLGPPSNSGVPGAPLTSVEPFTAARPELIDLDYLTSDNGASLRLHSEGDLYAREFHSLGDVNGDGTADFMFSTSLETTVVFGSGQRLHSDAAGESFASTPGFTLAGSYQIAGAGDINGDGVDDLAWTTFDGSRQATGVKVVFGRSDGQLQQAIEAPLAGVDGFDIVNGSRLQDIREVQAAGDFNDDGIDDLLIGSFAFNGEDFAAPNAWVVYGSRLAVEPSIDLATLNASQGLSLVSPLSTDQLAAVYDDIGSGYNATVTGGFDLNGDGVDDIAIGAYRFDWISQDAERRTYVVFGAAARGTGVLDLVTLDGIDGLTIGASRSYFPAPDRVSTVGDIDADGHVDLALVGDNGAAYVVYSSQNIGGASVERENLPSGAAAQVKDSSGESTIVFLRAVGDLDGDGADELGVELNNGQAAVIYGTTDQRLSSVDLAAAGNKDVTRLSGGGDSLSVGDAQPLVSLGDIDSDGIDDMGWGWIQRTYNNGITEIADINEDGVIDLQIGEPMGGNVSLLRVFYGFGQDGFTGVLASTQGPAPIALVEENYQAQLLTAMDDAARMSLDQINSTLSSGSSLGPVATACLDASSGVDTANVKQFNCADAAMAFTFNWGGGKYSGTGESRFAAVNRENDALQQLEYSSFPLPTGNPGSNPFQAYVSYDANTMLMLDSGYANTEGCSIDPQTRLTLDNPDTCSYLIFATTNGLADVFGPESLVQNLRIVR